MFKEIAIDETFDLAKEIFPYHVIRKWINQNLPDDKYSIENAIFIKHSLKWPLIIDPQNQASRWIKEMEGSNLKIYKNEDPSLFKAIEQAIRLGNSILIENVGLTLDPALDTLFKKEIHTKAGQKYIKLGNTDVFYNDSFKLYLITTNSNQHYLPSIFVKVNLINFSITFKCLCDQFLSLVVHKEQPELEDERNKLLVTMAEDMITLRELEDRSLGILNQSSDDGLNTEAKTLLDDQSLIDVLKQSKTTSQIIVRRIENNEDLERKLNLARAKYSAIAERGAILYFIVQSLSTLNVMYQFSLNWFYNIFQSCLSENLKNIASTENDIRRLSAGILRPNFLDASKRNSILSAINEQIKSRTDEELNAYIEEILMSLTFTVYQVTSWTLFAEHQIVFSFSICSNILKHSVDENVKISENELNFFLHSSIMSDMEYEKLTEKIELIENKTFMSELGLEEKTLRELLLLEELVQNKFENLVGSMERFYGEFWSELIKSKDPYAFINANGMFNNRGH